MNIFKKIESYSFLSITIFLIIFGVIIFYGAYYLQAQEDRKITLQDQMNQVLGTTEEQPDQEVLELESKLKQAEIDKLSRELELEKEKNTRKTEVSKNNQNNTIPSQSTFNKKNNTNYQSHLTQIRLVKKADEDRYINSIETKTKEYKKTLDHAFFDMPNREEVINNHLLNWIKSFEFDANSATNRVNIYNHLIYVFENGIPTDADFQSYDKYVTNYSE